MFCFKCIRQDARRLGSQVDLKIKKTEPPFLSSRKGRLYDSPVAAVKRTYDLNAYSYSIHERNNPCFHFILNCRIVMYLMTVSGINFCPHRVTRLAQPVRHLIDSFAIFSYRILISSDIVDRKVRRNLLCPLFSGDSVHHLCKIKHGLIRRRPGERIKRVFCMISLYIRIRTDPLISYLNVPTPFTHPSQKIPGKFCVRFLAPAVFHRFFQSRSTSLAPRKTPAVPQIVIPASPSPYFAA